MEQDNILVIAPEGTRSRTGALIEAKPGVSYLATKLNRPIVPVALTGTEDKALFGNLKRLRRAHITVTAGPAFTLPPLPRQNRDEALQRYTDEIMCHIAALLPERYRGVYANHPRLKELSATP
jgi:1-acyl-sn-glycerol-3-phosphate acyltransferase